MRNNYPLLLYVINSSCRIGHIPYPAGTFFIYLSDEIYLLQKHLYASIHSLASLVQQKKNRIHGSFLSSIQGHIKLIMRALQRQNEDRMHKHKVS